MIARVGAAPAKTVAAVRGARSSVAAGNSPVAEQVYIGLGSNRSFDGNMPAQQLQQALLALQAHDGIDVQHVSSYYCSAPVGPQDQADYVNAVACLATDLSPESLLDILQTVESEAGRCRPQERRWGERSLDLDILIFANRVIETPRLRVPHSQLTQRAFVLYPLQEIAPQLTVPGCGDIAELVASFERGPLAEQQVCVRLSEQ